MTHILVDTANNNHIRFDVQAETKQEAIEKLKIEEKRYENSAALLENIGTVGSVQPLSNGLSFYKFNDIPRPQVDEVINDVVDQGYKVLQESVDRVWEVTEKSFADMRSAMLIAVEVHYDEELKSLTTAADGKTISINSFLSQYLEAQVAFSAGETVYYVDTDDGSKVGLSQSSWDTMYTQASDAISTNYNTKKNKKNAINSVPDGATATLKNTWGNVTSTWD